MAEQSQPNETPQSGSQFGKSTRRRFLSRLGMASLLASAGPVLGNVRAPNRLRHLKRKNQWPQ